jgi:hypothetical protein
MIMGFSYHPRSFLKTKFGKSVARKNGFAQVAERVSSSRSVNGERKWQRKP